MAKPDPIPSDVQHGQEGRPNPTEQSLADQRREARYATNDPAEIQILPVTGQRLPATVLDVSRSGLRIELVPPLARGLQVEVKMPGKLVIFGEVRYCRRAGQFHHAGILIQDSFHSNAGRGGRKGKP